ncbi:MAG: hypothetical protein R3345_15500 [Fulvivirga sp.]|nr:hypothetical protein [Fulvivirga sp.]
MIFGGVGFMMNLLNLIAVLMKVRVYHFLILIGAAVLLKMLYGMLVPGVKDPITTQPLARKFFFIGMGVLAVALVMRTYTIPYYSWLLYVDIGLQIIALVLSFVENNEQDELQEEILDA